MNSRYREMDATAEGRGSGDGLFGNRIETEAFS